MPSGYEVKPSSVLDAENGNNTSKISNPAINRFLICHPSLNY